MLTNSGGVEDIMESKMRESGSGEGTMDVGNSGTLWMVLDRTVDDK